MFNCLFYFLLLIAHTLLLNVFLLQMELNGSATEICLDDSIWQHSVIAALQDSMFTASHLLVLPCYWLCICD